MISQILPTTKLLVVFTCSALVSAPVLVPPAYARPENPKTAGQRAVFVAYQSSLVADQWFVERKYAEAGQAYASAITAIQAAIQREPVLGLYHFPVKPTELKAARRMPSELINGEYVRPGDDGIVASRYVQLMEKMLLQCQQITGGDEFWTDERTAERAYADAREISLPVRDGEWDEVVLRLQLAVDKMEAVFGRKPKLRSGDISDSRWAGVTGEKALQETKAKLAAALPHWQRSQAQAATTVPENAQIHIDIALEKLAALERAAPSGKFMNDDDVTNLLDGQSAYMARLRNNVTEAYAREGRQAPTDVLEVVTRKIGSVQSAIDKHAGRWSYPASGSRDAVIEGKVRAQLVRNLRGAKVLRTSMESGGWTINKNELGIPEDRYKSGYVLYRLPQEKWARLSIFVYREQYAGGGRYSPANGASSYPGTRFQKAH